MVAITFSVLCGVACAFLIYVFAQFQRELRKMKKSSAGEPGLTDVDVRRSKAALMPARTSSHAAG
jgi:hypothetical protein